MEKFKLDILGCGSALPTLRHNPSAQVITHGNRLFLIDCGEGTQGAMRRQKISLAKINHIFISHHHGDHCFGLMGLLSTQGLLGRRGELHIYGTKAVGQLINAFTTLYGEGIDYPITFHKLDPGKVVKIYDSKTLEVWSFPLIHRIPCCGFLFREKPHLRHIRRDMIDFYHIPNYAINNIKLGADWENEEGKTIANSLLTIAADPIRSFAYCSDTRQLPNPPSILRDVDLLYHEATFGSEETLLAEKVGHSTARQAGETAKHLKAKNLIIGHFSSRYNNEEPLLKEAEEIFPNTQLAKEGMSIDIGPQ